MKLMSRFNRIKRSIRGGFSAFMSKFGPRPGVSEAMVHALNLAGVDLNSSANGDVVFCFHINDWKRKLLQIWLAPSKLVFVPFRLSEKDLAQVWLPAIASVRGARILSWGLKLPSSVVAFAQVRGLGVTYVEDGFLRSVGLGAEHALPMSLNFDSKTPYFDCTRESDLERLLASYDFDGDRELMVRADAAMHRLLALGLSKYNMTTPKDVESILGKRVGKRVLVLGQVEDDASIAFGSSVRYTNNDVVALAAMENPDSQIIYRPHPDVASGNRKMLSKPSDVEHLCKVLWDEVPLSQLLDSVDHVYTITSQAGFEAAMRGLEVTVLGCPFYAGWGITDDRQPCERRRRNLTVLQVFAAAYILYPEYFDHYARRRVEIEDVMDLLVGMRGW